MWIRHCETPRPIHIYGLDLTQTGVASFIDICYVIAIISHKKCTMTKSNVKVESQLDKFKQMAKELECDESEKAFDEKLGRLVKDKAAVKND